jgi:hypothetical protein
MLVKNQTHIALNELEAKITMNEGNIYNMRSFIDTKVAETNYESSLKDSKNLLRDINTILIKAASQG